MSMRALCFFIGAPALITAGSLRAQDTSPVTARYVGALRWGAIGSFPQAREELYAVLREEPTYSSARMRLKVLDDAQVGAIPPATAIHLFRAALHGSEGRHAEELAETDSSVALSSTYDEAYRLRGRARVELGDADGALRDYSRAIQLNARNSETYLNRAAIRMRSGDFEKAITDFSEAIARAPESAEAYAGRGVANASLARRELALADFDRAIQLDPGLALPYITKAQLFEDVGRQRDAIATLNELVTRARPVFATEIEYAKRRLNELARR
jgi:tetratricopeptide (TPR) repeat protein